MKPEQILTDIEQYLTFIKSQTGFGISLSYADTKLLWSFPALHNFSIHLNPYCNFIKTQKGTQGICSHKKNDSFIKKRHPFGYGCCFAGVEEFIYPVDYGKTVILYAHIFGFRGGLDISVKKFEHTVKKYKLSYTAAKEIYNGSLSEKIPEKEKIAAILSPLKYMFCRLYEGILDENDGGEIKKTLYNKILGFIFDNYQCPFTLGQMADELKYSVSHLQHTFYQNAGVSLTDYIINLRLQKAKELLESTPLNISQIAMSIGFNDSNYFSYTFKKRTGLSPREYRKNLLPY